MSETEPTKVCRLCAETIKAAAKVCPHCRKIQRRGFFISKYDLLAFISCGLFIGAAILLFNIFSEGRQYSPSRDKIEVLSSKISLNAGHDSTNVFISGILTNCSDYSWDIGRFEVRFFDKEGIVDAENGGDSFIVMPHMDHSFRIILYSRSSIPKHDSYRVRVQSAFDPEKWFPAD